MSNSALQSTEPATGNLLWEGQEGDANAFAAAARSAFAGWSAEPLGERIEIARRYSELVSEDADQLAELIARETGKPLWEARTEVASVVAKVEIAIEAQASRAGERTAEIGSVRQAVRHKPHGVMGVLGPYNFPAHLPNGHIVPALLAGNTIVFKPSGRTPATGEWLARYWERAGLPAGVLNLVQGSGAVSRAVASHPELDGLLFTGSTATGLALHRQFADRPEKMLALEMGGNNPLVVWEPQDVEAAAHLVVQSAYQSAGQRCTSARQLIVQSGREAALIDAIVATLDKMIVGAPFDDPAPFIGPVIDEDAAQGLERAWASLIASGGTVIRPLSRPVADRPFLNPGLIDVTGSVSRSDEEFFGPLLQLVRVKDFEGAIAEANATRFGLSAALIGGDEDLYRRFWSAARAGVVNWNRPTGGAASNAPFGGVGLSGNHRPSAYYAADYCAYPVASMETGQIVPGPLIGFHSASPAPTLRSGA